MARLLLLCMYNQPIRVMSGTTTQHFQNDMTQRRYVIDYEIGGEGNVVLTNVIDRGHKNGAERFELTDNGIIFVYNDITDKCITILFPRIGQLVSRFGDKFDTLPKSLKNSIKDKCREWQRRGYNEI